MEPLSISIIGAGPAGLSAAIYARRAGLAVTVWEKTAPGGQMNNTPSIENYPGVPDVGGFELGDKMRAQAAGAGAEFRSSEIQGVDLSGERPMLLTKDGGHECGALILAMGASPRKLDIAGEARLAGRGVSYCAVCDGYFFKGQDVAVIGGGNTALGDALYLSGICQSVTIVHRRNEFRGEAYLSKQVIAKPNIRLLLSAVPEEITGEKKVGALRVRMLEKGETQELLLSAVFAAVGSVPSTHLVRGKLALDDYGYILAGEDTRTSHPAVFAAGDIRKKELRQIITAAADGAVAATMAAHYLN
ncbi:MAG: FAD-dependent oxidoreductase [Oscillospiraceae bacterium]|jgi:thioredoxin reductase (NADPH)|nr:FAD-dependent oxidoreductase [Oscillospiraceae bacterium]